jgi:hypothetical protein
VIKDIIFGVVCLVLFFIVRYPQWIYFAGHSFTWLLFFLYFASDNNSMLLPTIALSISVGVVLLDVWICLTLTCFLGDYCCIGDAQDAPFSFSMQVCGENNRYETDSFVYIAVTTVGIAIVTGVSRTVSMYNTRTGASLYLTGATAYIMLKVYLLVWRNVQYSSFFIAITAISMATMFVGVTVSANFRFVATCLFLMVMLIDLSIVLGATNAVQFLNNYTLETKVPTFPGFGRRRLLQVDDVGDVGSQAATAVFAFERFPSSPARAALAQAAAALAAYVADPAAATATAEWATRLVDGVKDSFAAFAEGLRASVEEVQRSSADAVADRLVSLELKTRAADLLAHADAVNYVLGETFCCDPNTRFDLTIARLNAQLAEYDARFDQEFYGRTLLMMAAVQSASSDVANTPQVSNKQIRSWVQAVQQFLVKIWQAVTGTASSVTVNTVLPASAQSAELAEAAAAQAAEYAAQVGDLADQVGDLVAAQAAQACAAAAASARAAAAASRAAAAAAASLGESLAAQTAAVTAARAAQTEALTAKAAAEVAQHVEGAAARLAAATAASAVAVAEASRAALEAAADTVATEITTAAAETAAFARSAASASASAVVEVANDTGNSVAALVQQAVAAANAAVAYGERATRSLLRLIPTFGKSPWLNVPKFIRVVWVVIHCVCAAFNFVCTISLWTRDFSWSALLGGDGSGKKDDPEPVSRKTTGEEPAANQGAKFSDRFQMTRLNRRVTSASKQVEAATGMVV